MPSAEDVAEAQSCVAMADSHEASALDEVWEMASQSLGTLQQVGDSSVMQSDRLSAMPQSLMMWVQNAEARAAH